MSVGRARPAATWMVLAMASVTPASIAAAQSVRAESAYVARGREVEFHQRVFHDRLARAHATLTETLRMVAPGLLDSLQPPRPAVTGYQLLPRIISDAPRAVPAKPQVVSYGWTWSDTLFARETRQVDRLESSLAALAASPSTASHAAWQQLVADYRTIDQHRRQIDADVDYNWLWQSTIVRDRAPFDRGTRQIDALLAGTIEASSVMGRVSVPTFVRFEQTVSRKWVITVPLLTDISDSGFLRAFGDAVESTWQFHESDRDYRVRVLFVPIAPERLYCPPPATPPAGPCAPPATGDRIDLATHLARFPEGGGVLTTGAASTHVTAGRAIVLAPHELTPHVLAHEFGHLLGIPDGYLRGYRELGTNGFMIMELVTDAADIMSSPGTGQVLTRHFAALIDARDEASLMRAGLDALYQRRDAETAVDRFRDVLARNPDHYGATFQLAKALDVAKRTEEANTMWRRVLAMAEAAHDAETARVARARLGGVN